MAARDYPTAIGAPDQAAAPAGIPDRARAAGTARPGARALRAARARQGGVRGVPAPLPAGRGGRAHRLSAAHPARRGGQGAHRQRRGRGGSCGWKLSGGFAQTCRYDGSRGEQRFPATQHRRAPDPADAHQNALFTDVDLLARRRGERFDWIARLSAGYAKNFGQAEQPPGQRPTRVSVASFELADRPLGPSGPPRPPGGNRTACSAPSTGCMPPGSSCPPGHERRRRLPGRAAEPGAADATSASSTLALPTRRWVRTGTRSVFVAQQRFEDLTTARRSAPRRATCGRAPFAHASSTTTSPTTR